MRKIHIALILLGSSLLLRCVPEPLEVTGLPVVRPQIVLSTQMLGDQSLIVLLTKTFGALDASDDSDPEALFNQIAVDDAFVTLSGPDGVDTLFAIRAGVFGGVPLNLSEGQFYTLTVASETLGTVHATTQVMPRITFDDISATLFFNGFDDSLAQVTYRLSDPPLRNWYLINVQEVEREDVVENLLNPRAFNRLVVDDEFNGSTYQETFRVVPRDYSPGDTIAVTLSNISEDYYRFLKLRQDNRFSFIEYLSEPINYPSNVVGGRGYFNLYIPDPRIFILQ